MFALVEQAFFSLTDYLVEAAWPLLLGVTVILAIGWIGMKIQRSPIGRQRLGELTMVASLLWLLTPLLPDWKSAQPAPDPETSTLEVEADSIALLNARDPFGPYDPGLDENTDPIAKGFPETGGELVAPFVAQDENHQFEERNAFEIEAYTNEANINSAEVTNSQPPFEPTDLSAEAHSSQLVENNHQEPPAVSQKFTKSDETTDVALIGYLNESKPLVVIYLCGIALAVGWLLVGQFLLWRMIAKAKHVSIENLAILDKAGLSRVPRVLQSDHCHRVITFGIFKPTVIVPQKYLSKNRLEQLQNVLLHELGHIRQRDAIGQTIMNAAFLFFYFHPVYWMIRKRVCFERELVIDDWAAQRSDKPQYISDLIALARQQPGNSTGPKLVMGAIDNSRSQFYRRIKMLVQRKNKLETRRTILSSSLHLLTLLAIFAVAVMVIDVPAAVGQDEDRRKLAEIIERLEAENVELQTRNKIAETRIAELQTHVEELRMDAQKVLQALQVERQNSKHEAARREQQMAQSEAMTKDQQNQLAVLMNEQEVYKQEIDRLTANLRKYNQEANPFSNNENKKRRPNSKADPFAGEGSSGGGSRAGGNRSAESNKMNPFNNKRQNQSADPFGGGNRSQNQKAEGHSGQRSRGGSQTGGGQQSSSSQNQGRSGQNQGRGGQNQRSHGQASSGGGSHPIAGQNQSAFSGHSNGHSELFQFASSFADAKMELDIAKTTADHLSSLHEKKAVSELEFKIAQIKLRAAEHKFDTFMQYGESTMASYERELKRLAASCDRLRQLEDRGYISRAELEACEAEIATLRERLSIVERIIGG